MLAKYKKVLCKYLIPVFIILCSAGSTSLSFSQIDDEFWFVVPELSHRGNTGGTPGTLRLATMELPATVIITQPANPAFTDIVVNLATNSSAAVDLSHLIDVAASPGITGLENKPLTADGINNYGLYITSTNMITAYWEINYSAGSDLWTLKGGNGLGTEFYTPFQDFTFTFPLVPEAYSAIDVVATQSPTTVTFELPPGVAASYGNPEQNVPAGGTHNVALDRGQTFSLFPIGMSGAAADRLKGTRITSTAPISVTLKDDAVFANPNGQDVVGDQIVPVNITGSDYIVPYTGAPTYIHVVATAPNTSFDVINETGLLLTSVGPLGAGEQHTYLIPGGTKYARITTNGPSVYVFQIGSDNKGRGGALVPAIGCTGNTQLAFTRARENKFNFFLIVELGNEDKFYIDGILQTGLAGTVFGPSDFTLMPGIGNYMVLFTNSIPASKLSTGQHLVENSGGIFHLGIQNGFTGNPQRIYYGYYSDFGGLNIGANVAGTNSSVVRACYGDPVQLYAFGGTEYTWTPDAYLDDATSNTPTAINLPPGAHAYVVEVGGACKTDSIELTVLVSEPVVGHFVTDVSSSCAPQDIIISDQSTGVYEWEYDLGDGSPLVRYDLNPATPQPQPPGYPAPFNIVHNYVNTDTTPVYDTIRLLVKNESGCSDILNKTLIIFPQIQSGFNVVGGNDDGCDPLVVQFQNTSAGDTSNWLWLFGDGGSTTEKDPTHVFRNQFGPDNLVFTTRLITTSPDYCRDTSSHTITVRPYIEAKFAFDTAVACSPHQTVITNQSIGADTYFWDFGDGTTSTSSAAQIVHNFTNLTPAPVTYTVSLRVDNEEGCFHTLTQDITINPEISAAFLAAPNEVCSPEQVSFQNNSVGAATYVWDFGDGGTSTDFEPVHLYDKNLSGQDTTLTVTLISTTTEFCNDTATFDLVMHPYINAAFSVDDIIGCHPFTINIENESVGVDTFSWDFGDGTPGSNTSAASFVHTYLNTGAATAIYPFRLVVGNDEGCSDTLTRNITVHPEMTANFSVDTSQGCHPLTVSFTDLSLNAVEYFWDFGDGATSLLASPTHTFTNFGFSDSVYTVTLTTTSGDGECVKQVSLPITVHGQVDAEFTLLQALDCTPFTVNFDNLSLGGTSYNWDWDDGSDTTVTNTNDLNHVFINSSFSNIEDYNVTLTVVNGAGCADQLTRTVSVYPDIQTGFTASVTQGCHPLDVDFTNLTSGGQTYIWDFGDGGTSSLTNPSHTFTNLGSVESVYTVTLISLAPNNVCRDTITLDITVYPRVEADFTFQGNLQCTPSTIQFYNATVGGNTYTWDFGDGSDSVMTNTNPVSHIYNNTSYTSIATYQVSLTAENSSGCSSQITRDVQIYPDIKSSFSVSVSEGCHPLVVDFTNASSGANTYYWDFDDGASSEFISPSHTFDNYSGSPVTRQVKLTAISQYNCIDDTTINITIQPKPLAGFVTDKVKGCPLLDIRIINGSIYADQYDWSFGDGTTLNTSSAAAITNTYDNQTASTVVNVLELIASTSYGCADTTRQNITVYARAVAAFSSINEGCNPLTVDFNNQSQRGSTYLWDFGDGSFNIQENPSNTFYNYSDQDTSFYVSLTTFTEFSCADTIIDIITVHPQPEAEFMALPTHQTYPSATVSITNVTNPGPYIYLWDFDDGSTSNLEDPPDHVYAAPGEYDIFLFVSSAYCTDSTMHTVIIFPSPPIASFDSIVPDCEPYTVHFTNTSLHGETYLWEFDDGSTSTEFEPTHTFTEDGNYNVKLTVMGEGGFDYTYRVVDVFTRPEVDFFVEPTLVMLPDQIAKVFNLTKYGATFLWDFGDGTTSEQNEGEHLYTEPGIYDISLNAWSEDGCEAYLLQPRAVEVQAEPVFYFPTAFAPNPSGSPGLEYNPNNPSNEIFFPVYQNVVEYHLYIYNRWGELVFETNKLNEGWDGYCGSVRCTEGVYVWRADITYVNGQRKIHHGDVTLFHKK